MLTRLATAPVAAAALIAGYAVAVATGSRPLGGVVLVCLGLVCVAISRSRDSRGTTILLAAIGLGAFAFSHVLALLTGGWLAVLLVAAGTAAACWWLSDRDRFRPTTAITSAQPGRGEL